MFTVKETNKHSILDNFFIIAQVPKGIWALLIFGERYEKMAAGIRTIIFHNIFVNGTPNFETQYVLYKVILFDAHAANSHPCSVAAYLPVHGEIVLGFLTEHKSF